MGWTRKPEPDMDDATDRIAQAAAIPCRGGQICLVTSRSGRRWVVPKGMIDPGHTASETALIETWEEAGLVGHLTGDAIGSFVYSKFENTYHVTVFVMQVTHEAERWPESNQRQKKWIEPHRAAELVDDAGLKELILAVGERSMVGA
jgi:8-oxo-dGTP pyrophosphatase MutT (NUDIX family)